MSVRACQKTSPMSRVVSFWIVAVLVLQHLLIISPITSKASVSTAVVISEFRVRGPMGGNDEFIELYNLTDASINIGGWKINGSNGTASVSTRLTIAAGTSIPAHGHFLATNSAASGYSGAVTGNQTYSTGVTDDGGIALLDAGNNIIDQVGMSAGSAYKEGTTLSSLGSSNLDRCYERKPGSTAGNSQDTDINSADFQLITPCNPQNLSSAPTPTTSPTPTPTPTPSNAPPTIKEPANPVTTVAQDSAPFTVGLSGSDDNNVFNWSATAGPGVSNVAVTGGQGTPNITYTVTLAAHFTGTASFTASLSNNVNPPVSQPVNIAVTSGQSVSGSVAISQVYGGGGNTGSTLKNDFIELINRSAAPVDLSGWSVQVFSSSTSTWDVTPLSNVTLQPGQYYLVQESQGAGGTDNLPTPDASGTIAVSSTSSKIALVNSTTVLTGTCPTGSGIADFVGYGSNTGNPPCVEGSGPAPLLTNTTAALRLNEGCYDTNDNAFDFTVGDPAPRNTSSAVHGCTGISGFGSADPSTVLQGQSSTLKVRVAGAQNPDSTAISVVADLSSIGGSAIQAFVGSGPSYSFTATIPTDNAAGMKSLPVTISDAEGRSFQTDIKLSVLPLIPDHIVMSQIYGGGGNTSATFNNDYVELYNPTDETVTITGWTLQYASATGTTWTNNQPLGGIIGPHQYYLVKLGAGSVARPPLPIDPNISGDINMAAGAGKLALVKDSEPLSGGCPVGIDPDIVDFVGYGATASCHEGGANAPAPSNTSAIFRKNGGGTDTDQNGNDFTVGTPDPRRTEPVIELGPWVAGTEPTANDTVIPHDATVTLNFSEPVDLDAGWYDITCAVTGSHNDATVGHTGDFKTFAITPNANFQFGETCTVNIAKTAVHDRDMDDSGPDTDTLFADQNWSFTVVDAGQPAPYDPSVHLTMGNPTDADGSDPANFLMTKPTYALSYNSDKGTPNWVSWHLDNSWYGTLGRVDTFRADPQIPSDWYRVEGFDYADTGFDRGHMTPNADRDNQFRIPINQETYLMTNMVPQAPDNNQGPWANLEGALRVIADAGNELYIVSGPAGVGGSGSNGGVTSTIANGHVTVPAFTWKVVLVIPKDSGDDISRVSASSRTIAVIMPNVQGIRNNDWHNYLTTVDAVEQLTGYDLFENLPDAVENSVEAGVDGSNPPGTADQFVQVNEDGQVAFTLNAVNPTNTTLTATTSQPAHGGVSCVSTNCTYTPTLNFNGQDSFTFSVSNGTQTSNTSTVTINVIAVNDAPTFTAAAPDTLTVDYSDEIQPVNITVADVDDSADSLVVTQTGLPNGLTLAETSAGQWSITGRPDVPQGAYVVDLTVTDPSTASSPATVTINVGKEKADPSYTGDEDILTAGPSISTASVRLGAHLNQQDDGFPGDISKAKVTFELFKSSNSGPTPDLVYAGVEVNGDGDALKTVTLPADLYSIVVKVDAANTYWAHSDIGLGILNITVPTTEQRSTGGGWVPDPASSDGKGHFGFSVTAGKNSSSAPKGNLSFSFRGTDGYIYKARANSWQGGYLQFSAEPGTDVFARSNFRGSCNVQKIDPLTGIVVESWGNFTFEVFSKDGDQLAPRQPDAFSIVLKDKNGSTLHQIGAGASLVDLGGGNITNKTR